MDSSPYDKKANFSIVSNFESKSNVTDLRDRAFAKHEQQRISTDDEMQSTANHLT
jgi:hypothetical protein